MNAAPRHDEGIALDPALLWILRLGVAACFIGHGSLGLNQTAAWTSYFGVAGIGPDRAMALMPWVGAFDWIMGLSVLFVPSRAVVLYMTAWCVWTALLRPLAGESGWEAVERAGNYGAPLALFFLFAPARGLKGWFSGRFREGLDAAQTRTLGWILRLTTGLLLLGHGLLGASVIKPALGLQYARLGLPGATVEPWVGAFECLLAAAVLLRPGRGLLFGVLLWKLASEALSPMTGSPLWVFIEHGGSYAAPLALAFLLPGSRPVRSASTLSSTT
jgi:uncharacterized membrane protein YphA (DoxX/SURF4 family)